MCSSLDVYTQCVPRHTVSTLTAQVAHACFTNTREDSVHAFAPEAPDTDLVFCNEFAAWYNAVIHLFQPDSLELRGHLVMFQNITLQGQAGLSQELNYLVYLITTRYLGIMYLSNIIIFLANGGYVFCSIGLFVCFVSNMTQKVMN